MKAGALKPLDHAQPHRPIRINEDVHPTELDEERRMPNPGDANFAGLYFWKKRVGARATSFGKKRGDENLSEKIALVPVESRFESDATAHGRFFASVLRASSDNAASLAGKGSLHGRPTI